MGEALGLASGVAGIVSLGVRIVEGLLKYYTTWKDQDNDISNMCASLNYLSGTLKILEKSIQPPAIFDEGVRCIVENNINNIDRATRKLDGELSKVQETQFPKTMRVSMRRHVRRALYPFREEILNKIRRLVSEARQNLDLSLQALQVHSGLEIRYKIDLLVRRQDDSETRSILSWLSPKNFWLHQADLANQRQPGTGEWLLQNPDFLEWAKGNKGTVWCQGNPGVGKTVLVSAVVEFLESDLPAQDIGLAFIYCNHKAKLSQTIDYFVGAILRQMIERRPVIPEDVRTLYDKRRGKETRPTCTEYMNLLQALAKECSEVYIVIDALDECIGMDGQPIWSDLLTKLKDVIFEDATIISIRASEADITTYVTVQLQSKDVLLQFCREDSTLKIDILQAVVSKADGMFLAAQLHLESLASKTNRRAVRRALHELPATLYGSYDEAVERINQQSTKTLAWRVLSWIVYAVRPLQVAELQHAVAVDELEPDDRSISEDSLTPQSILVNACAGLIRVDEVSNIIGLVHKTTQEYFDRFGTVHFPQAQRDIGTTCLKYLSLEVFSEGPCCTDELYGRRLSENVLLGYASRYLGNHIHEITEHNKRNLILKFFLDEDKVSSASQVVFVDRMPRFLDYSQMYPVNFHGVHYAAYFGMEDILRLLFENDTVEPDRMDSFEQTPLLWAARNEHEAVVKLLLKLLLKSEIVGMDSEDSVGLSPRPWPVRRREYAIMKLLLDSGKVELRSLSMVARHSLMLQAHYSRQ